MKESLISIIVPCYNVDAFLEKCINSIIYQTYNNWELILIDDGSSDNTLKICKKYSTLDKRIKVIHKKNEGVSVARNVGIDIANGEWITFLDSDDWMELDTLESCINKITNNVDLIQFNHYYNYPNKEIKRKAFNPSIIKREGIEIKDFLLDTFTPYYDIKKNNIYTGPIRGVWAKFYKLSIIKEYNIRFILGLKIAEDSLFCYDYMSHCKKIIFYNEYKIHYRVHGKSIMQKFNKDVELTNYKIIDEFIKRSDINDGDYQEALTGLLSNCLFSACKLKYFHKGNKMSFSDKYLNLRKFIETEQIRMILNFNKNHYIQKGKKEIILLAQKKQYLILLIFSLLLVKLNHLTKK